MPCEFFGGCKPWMIFRNFWTKGESVLLICNKPRFYLAKNVPKGNKGIRTPKIAFLDVQIRSILGKKKLNSNVLKFLEHSVTFDPKFEKILRLASKKILSPYPIVLTTCTSHCGSRTHPQWRGFFCLGLFSFYSTKLTWMSSLTNQNSTLLHKFPSSKNHLLSMKLFAF